MSAHAKYAPKYTRELDETICQRLANGEALKAICREDAMPASRTVRTWVAKDLNGFAARYAQARELGLREVLARGNWKLSAAQAPAGEDAHV